MPLTLNDINKEALRILVVDDISSMRRVVASFLFELGYRSISQAEGGQQALSQLIKDGFDFVVTDWNMPGMTGLELLQEIRKHPDLKHIPVLLITAEARKENVIAAAQAGANGYVVKPFTYTVLGTKIINILSKVPVES